MRRWCTGFSLPPRTWWLELQLHDFNATLPRQRGDLRGTSQIVPLGAGEGRSAATGRGFGARCPPRQILNHQMYNTPTIRAKTAILQLILRCLLLPRHGSRRIFLIGPTAE